MNTSNENKQQCAVPEDAITTKNNKETSTTNDRKQQSYIAINNHKRQSLVLEEKRIMIAELKKPQRTKHRRRYTHSFNKKQQNMKELTLEC